MSHFDLQVDWLPPPSEDDAHGPERSTWARLQILIAGESVTSNHPADYFASDTPYVVGAMSGLADWIVDSWLAIHFEIHTPFPKACSPRPGLESARLPSLRDAQDGWAAFLTEPETSSGNVLGAWQQRHTFGLGASDIALPSIVFVPEDPWMGIGLDHTPASLSPTVRFTASPTPSDWPAPPRWVPLSAVLDTLARFVDDTIQRARTQGDTRAWADWLAGRWTAVKAESHNPKTVRTWKFGPMVASQWEQLGSTVGTRHRALIDLLTDSATIEEQAALDSLVEALLKPTSKPLAKGIIDRYQVDWQLPPHLEGYRLAQALRKTLGIGSEPIPDIVAMTSELGIDSRPTRAHGLFRSAGWFDDTGASLIWATDDSRFAAHAPQRFSIAAALGRLLTAAQVNHGRGAAHGAQSRWRPTQFANAFAAELLLPKQSFQSSQATHQTLAREYGISGTAASWHIKNRLDADD